MRRDDCKRILLAVPLRRMQDHIRNLCQKLIDAHEGSEEHKAVSAELQAALSRQIGEIRKRLKTYPLPKERRSIEG